MTQISDPFTLPGGAVVPNRLVKAAMTEQIAGPDGAANARHERLYRRWAEGGIGLQITGNMMVDRRHREHPANIMLDPIPTGEAFEGLQRLAQAAKSRGALALVQLSHSGRQTPKIVNAHPEAPSPVTLGLPGSQFGEPKAMTEDDITRTASQFVAAAEVIAKAGFDGVQVHGAHGYLLSSFLNPRANQREDGYGGSLENRARLLLEVVERIRERLPASFVLSVKLNSSDFQKGGLSTEDSLQVADWLAARGVDLLEVSGGNYEQPAMMDIAGMERRHEERKAESTKTREAYFLVFAEAIRQRNAMPLMVTGGFRSLSGMNDALSSGATDLIGLARPLCVEPDLPKDFLTGRKEIVPSYEKFLRIGPGWLGPHSPIKLVKALNGFSAMSFFYDNIARMADGREPTPKGHILKTFIAQQKAAKDLASQLPNPSAG
ncbi:MAG: NADH:flavin oxidoreductase/NADH oxidase family protein [Parvularcula sp.]|jgi:2,4-dienoyl-CoA reductase-like NADH-dependent reductase (Old Yellow Enzyme family)|nr:NADH:flavin oxidoreductase/NADH oxidase family protein [Parvularcula sp.]